MFLLSDLLTLVSDGASLPACECAFWARERETLGIANDRRNQKPQNSNEADPSSTAAKLTQNLGRALGGRKSTKHPLKVPREFNGVQISNSTPKL